MLTRTHTPCYSIALMACLVHEHLHHKPDLAWEMPNLRFHHYTHRGRAALLLMSTERLAVSASSFTVPRWYLRAKSGIVQV